MAINLSTSVLVGASAQGVYFQSASAGSVSLGVASTPDIKAIFNNAPITLTTSLIPVSTTMAWGTTALSGFSDFDVFQIDRAYNGQKIYVNDRARHSSAFIFLSASNTATLSTVPWVWGPDERRLHVLEYI